MIGSLQNEGVFQSIFQSTTEGVFVINKDGTILIANPACKNLFGYNPDDLLGKSIEVITTTKHREQLKYEISILKDSTFSREIDLVGIINNGTEFRLEIKLNSIIINGENLIITFFKKISNSPENLPKIQQTNKSFLEGNRKFDALVNNLQGIVYRRKNDRDWTMEYISEGCKQITGYSAKKFLNGTIHFSHISLQEDQEQVWNNTQRAINNKEPFAQNFRIRDKKGDIKHLQELGQGVFDKNGDLEAIEGFILNVTSQKETELIIKASDAQVNASLEAILDMIFIKYNNGKHSNFYTPLKQNLVTPSNDIIGENMIDVLPLETYKKAKKTQERTQEVMSTVQKLVKTNLNLEDQILITEEAEKNALESRALTAAIAKNFPKGFILIINKDMQLVLAEGEALDQLGLKPLIFEGTMLDDISIFTEALKPKIKEYISKTFSGTHLSFEIEYKKRHFSVNTTPLFNDNNQVSNALMVFNDISQQKEIEFRIQNALKKEKKINELKSRFVSMASHEFRTPLSAILVSAILIGKQNKQEKEAKREKYIAQIEKNVNHLVTILNDFLSLSKLEEGKVKTLKEDFDIVCFAKTIINENKIGLKKGQQIHFTTTVNTLFVYLDTKLLRHVITNLLSNASKYSKEHTDINFKITEKKDKVIIQISDQGIGIPEEDRVQIFHRFYRAHNATNIEGTGLGLNISKHYTELMGGSIGFKSNIDKGTSFWVELPIINK